jgi:hypothetical protein
MKPLWPFDYPDPVVGGYSIGDDGEEPVICSMAGCACVITREPGCPEPHFCKCHSWRQVRKEKRRWRREGQSKWLQ